MPNPHSYDLVAERLAEWINETAGSLADGFREHGKAPFAADASQRELMAYYSEQFFNPDGSPNSLGRQAQQGRLGDLGYYRALAEVTQARMERSRMGLGGDLGDGTGD